MTPWERLICMMHREQIDRPLNFDIIMAFAPHYIGQPLADYYLDHRVLAAANLAVQEAFDLDIVQAISDPYREAVDLGAEVLFPTDGLPVRQAPLLTVPQDLSKLQPCLPENGQRMMDRVCGVRLLKERVGGQVPVMGWVEGSLSLAAVLRGDSALLLDLYDRRDWVHELLDFCAAVEIDFARAQIAAGADIIGLGDAIASQIAPHMYLDFALPYEQRIFAAVHEMGAIARLHICGDITRLLELLPNSGADIIDLDWMVDLERAAQILGGRVLTCGNFDPVAILFQGTPDQVRQAAISCQQAGGPTHISAAGCEVPDGTPHPNLLAHASALREIGASGGLSA